MNNWLSEFDFDRTIRDFEYTRRAETQMRRVYDSDDFEDADAETIFAYLFRDMQLVFFGDYLKRYIYERAAIEEPFHSVPIEVYQEIIKDTFQENNTPLSEVQTTRRKSVIIKQWLTGESVKRSNVFLLGFGLAMTVEDVSVFLKKVIKEQDFDFSDPEETIFWYCFKNHMGYPMSQNLKRMYEEMQVKSNQPGKRPAELLKLPGFQLEQEESLMCYLQALKNEGIRELNAQKAYEQFCNLLEQTKDVIANIYQSDAEETGNKHVWTAEDISAGDVESILCSGIPKMKNGNLQKVSASMLGQHFNKRRMSRQRIDQILKKKAEVERFDLITLEFFLFSQKEELEDPVIRFENYVQKINRILRACGMMELYSVNPYETFIQMCLLTEAPLAVYADIWEMSYNPEGVF